MPAADGFGDKVFFVAHSEEHGSELFVTDGTAEGTKIHFESRPGPDSYYITDLQRVGSHVVFQVQVAIPEEESLTSELWITNCENTTRVDNSKSFIDAVDGSWTELDGELYFLTDTEDPDLAKITNIGGGKGTYEIVNDLPDGDFTYEGRMAIAGDTLFFSRNRELWMRNQIVGEPRLVMPFELLGVGDFNGFGVVSGGVVFQADDGSGDRMRLHFSDGTTDGTVPIFDSSPSEKFTTLHAITTVGGQTFFNIGSELHVTDGTESGTKFVRSLLTPPVDSSGIVQTRVIDGKHVAVLRDGTENRVITSTDGDGKEIARHTIKSDRFVTVGGLGVRGDELLIGYRIDDAPFDPDDDHVSKFNVNTGAFKELYVEEDDNFVGAFEDIVTAGDLTIFQGPRTDQELSNEIWTTGGDSADTKRVAENTDGGGSTTGGVVTLHIRGGRNDNFVDGSEIDEKIVITRTVQFESISSTKAVDLSADMDAIRGLFEKGYRTIVVTATISEGEARIRPIGGSGSSTVLNIDRGPSVIGQLRDHDGRLLDQNFASLDLRNLPAGEYFVGVSRAGAGTMTTDYTLQLDAAILGDAHDLEADDVLHGGDGDDVIIGGPGKDALHGESGDDALVGESFERRDVAIGDVVRSDLRENDYSVSRSPRSVRDHRVVVDRDSDDVTDIEVNLGNPEIARAVATSLGVTLNTTASGMLEYVTPIYQSDLASISELDLSNRKLIDLDGIEHLTGLRTLDVSGNEFTQQAIPQVDLRSFIGSQAIDAGIANASEGWQVHDQASATGGSYLSLDTVNVTADGVAKWTLDRPFAKQLEVYAAWHGNPSHVSKAVYSVNGIEIGIADQRLASTGIAFGDRQLQRIGSFAAKGSVKVTVSSGSGDGLLIADVLVLRPVDGAPADNLVHLDVRGTSLGESQRDLLLGQIVGRGGVVHADANAAPAWSGPSGLAIEAGGATTFDDLNHFFDDDGPGPLTFTAVSNDSAVELRFSGSGLKVIGSDLVKRVIPIELTATDADGLATTVSLNVAVGFGLAQGRVVDNNGQPIEGLRIVGDNTDEPDRFAITDANGRYSVLVGRGDGQVRVADGENAAASAAVNDAEYSISDPVVITGVDFVVTLALRIMPIFGGQEGDVLLFELVIADNVSGDVNWQVDGGPFDLNDSSPKGLKFTPRDAGVYRVTATINDPVLGSVTTSSVVRIDEVIASLIAGDDVTVPEGPLNLTRTLVRDPGDDLVNVTIDYGNGDSQTFGNTPRRTFDLQTFYSQAVHYTVTVTLDDGQLTTTRSFDVNVNDTVPTLSFNGDEPFVAGGRAGLVDLSISDPANTINRLTWSYFLDWGDGSLVEDITGQINIINGGAAATASPTHVYDEGTYTATLRVIDADGDDFEATFEVVVANDRPILSVLGEDDVREGDRAGFIVTIDDADAIASLVWDFGDGSALQQGSQVEHVYGAPGEYIVTVTATDVDGASSHREEPIQVTPVNDAPIVVPINPVTITETQPWVLPVTATDEDSTSLTYSVDGAPIGLTIDDHGVVRWTPTIDQGPASYDFDVRVDDGEASTSTRVNISVRDTGSISGELFVDRNGNGRREPDELDLNATSITLDEGDDGTVDRTLTVDQDGTFRFDSLPIGLYRVAAELSAGTEPTTPWQYVVDMSATGDIRLTPIGGTLDADGDGISNEAEQNLVAGGDGNDDGIPDWRQGNVASLQMPGGVVTIVSNVGTKLANLTAADPLANSPDEAVLPLGRINFDVTGLPSRGRAEVELIFGASSAISAVYQVDPNAAADDLFRLLGESADETVDVQPDRLRIGLPDGGSADLDAIANGIVSHSLQPAAVDATWTNPVDQHDVNGDGEVTALDALLVINALWRHSGTYELPTSKPAGEHYLDVNGNGHVTALDALLVINQLWRRDFYGSTKFGEGESQPSSDSSQAVPEPASLEKRDDDESVSNDIEAGLF